MKMLSDKELDAILIVTEPKAAADLQEGKGSAKVRAAAVRVDKALANSDTSSKGITIYKLYQGEGVENFRRGGVVLIDSFLVGTKKKPQVPKESVLLAIKVPKGYPTLEFPEGLILERGLTLILEATEGDVVEAVVMSEFDTLKASGSINLSPLEIEEFFNSCHSPDDGQFCGGNSKGGGGGSKRDEEDERVAKEVGLSANQVRSIREYGHNPMDYDSKGKPVPGTDSWKDAHGIDKKVYDSRPMKRYKGPNDPVIDEFYGDLPPNQKKFARRIASQEDGLLMNRKPVPGAEEKFGKVTPQIRPDNKIILDQRTVARKEKELKNARERFEQVKGFTPEDIIKERQEKVKEAKTNVDELKSLLPHNIRQRARYKKEEADYQLSRAKKSGDEARILKAEEVAKEADRYSRHEKKRADELEKDPGRAVSRAEQELGIREDSLARARANPEATLKGVRAYSGSQIPKKEEQLAGVPIKYVFPPGKGSASRIEANSDAQNLKNLTQGKGRVYFVMEGNAKADAVLSRVKKEDPKAAVISVPSVTAWPDAETDWVSQKYLKGREVILIPDADGIKNVHVVQQSKKLRGKLLSNGVENVILASPPVITNNRGGFKVETLRFPSGTYDERKGVDDHLGLGRGTLGDLVYNDSPAPNFDTTGVSKQYKKNRNSIPNSNKTINAISDMTGERGIGRVSGKSIEKYSGLSPSSVNDSVKRLESMEVIKVHHIFNPQLLGHGRRVPTMEPSEVGKLARRARIPVPDLTKTYVSDEDNYEIAPIVEIINPSYITKNGPPKTLASRYKSLKTSSGAPKPAGAGGRPGVRLVRTPEGAKRYNTPVGQPIPEDQELGNTGTVELSLVAVPPVPRIEGAV